MARPSSTHFIATPRAEVSEIPGTPSKLLHVICEGSASCGQVGARSEECEITRLAQNLEF